MPLEYLLSQWLWGVVLIPFVQESRRNTSCLHFPSFSSKQELTCQSSRKKNNIKQ